MQDTVLTPEQAEWLAVTIERNRSLYAGWSMEDGADDAGDKSDDDVEDSDADSEDDKSDDTEPDWKAKFEAQQRITRNLERRTKKDAQRIKELGAKTDGKQSLADKTDETVDVEKIRAEARAEAAREALNGRVEDKIEAKAAAFADPEDAVAVLMRSHDIEDFIDGDKPDVDAIVDALKELGEKKPHLLAQGGKRFQGGADQGTRKESKGRAKSLGDAIARHYEKS